MTLTPELIEAIGKIVLAIIAALAPIIMAYIAFLKARAEADEAWERVRFYETGKAGCKRKKTYLPWRRGYARPNDPIPNLEALRSEDHSSHHPSPVEGGSEEDGNKAG